MARRSALLTEVFIFISCGLILVINGQECLPNPGNLESLVGHSPIVLHGRVVETRPSASHPDDSGLFDAVISLVTVFKGQVDGGSQERIVVGPFGTSESAQICVGEARSIGDELVLFLSASGDSSADVGALRHFRLVANPVVADAENRRTLQGHASPSLRDSQTTNCIQSEYCLHGGTCHFTPALEQSYCVCTPGFKGKRCQKKVARLGTSKTHASPSPRHSHTTSCIQSEYCLHGGSCYVISDHELRYCICTQGFEGTRCEDKVTIFSPIEMLDMRMWSKRTLADRRNSRYMARQRRMFSSTWSKIGVQTNSTKSVSLPGNEDSADDRYHSNGGGQLRTNVATSDDNARLLRPQKQEDVREPSLHSGRTGQNGPLETGDLPVPVESSRNVVSASL